MTESVEGLDLEELERVAEKARAAYAGSGWPSPEEDQAADDFHDAFEPETVLRLISSLRKKEVDREEDLGSSQDLGTATGVKLEREALIALIMRETTDEIIADGWQHLGSPNVLEQGCRYIRGPHGRGYENPELGARNFAGMIADAILSLFNTPVVSGGGVSNASPESSGKPEGDF